jgi:PAS domain S-box-containing protein
MNVPIAQNLDASEFVSARTRELFKELHQNLTRYTDRLFSRLMIFQWFFAVGLAFSLSPRTWAGTNSQIHPHIWAAIFLGGIITAFPVYLARTQSGKTLTRHVIAVGQMLMGALLIHLTGGRIETHFHIFGSLAILAFYRDWRVLVTATIVVTADHLVRGIFWPQSIFGVLYAPWWRPFEHAGWVLFEVTFLIIAIRKSVSEMQEVAERQAKLEVMNETIERTVAERTVELSRENRQHRELQALYSSLVEQLPAGIFRKDTDGRFVFVNSWFCKLRNRVPHEILGKTAGEIADSEPDGSVVRLLRRGVDNHAEIMRTGKTIESLEEYSGTNGGSHLKVVKSPVFGADGDIVGTQGVLMDISEQKRAEAALDYEKLLLNALLVNSDDKIYFKDLESNFTRCSVSMAKAFKVQKPEELVGKHDRDFYASDHAAQAFEDEQKIIRTGEPLVGKLEKETWPDGHVTWVISTKMPLRDDDGKITGTFGVSKEVTNMKVAEEALSRERNLLSAILNNIPDSVYVKDTRGRKTKANPADLRNLRCKTEADALGKTDFELFPRDIAEKFYADDQTVIQGQPIVNREEYFFNEAGEKHWLLTTKIPLHDQNGTIIGLVGMGRDITAIKESELKLEESRKQLLDASRQAGMAEVATSVLHNVGNVLNSVNVSTSLIAEKIQRSKVANIVKVVELMRANTNDLGNFITNDPKGKQLPEYLAKLAEHLTQEQQAMFKEVGSLMNNVVHIKEIVAMQQGYAKAAGIIESLKASDLVEDAIRMNSGAVDRHKIKIVREFYETPLINTDKHKVLQILVNLIRNSKYACDDSGRDDKQITLQVRNGDGRVKISIIDNGVGIPPENLTRIFNHGFTTRKEGHGFGLHSGAIAAKELGGTLTARSEGIGHGATFTLELPATQKQETYEHQS